MVSLKSLKVEVKLASNLVQHIQKLFWLDTSREEAPTNDLKFMHRNHAYTAQIDTLVDLEEGEEESVRDPNRRGMR